MKRKNKKFISILLSFNILICLGQDSVVKKALNKDNIKYKVAVIMDGACAAVYHIDNNGFCVTSIGHSNDYLSSFENFKLLDTLSTNSFRLLLKNKREFLKAMKEINKYEVALKKNNWDGWRCLVWIDDVLKIDSYGTSSSKELEKALKLLDSKSTIKLKSNSCAKI
jgi:hypothetical protein